MCQALFPKNRNSVKVDGATDSFQAASGLPGIPARSMSGWFIHPEEHEPRGQTHSSLETLPFGTTIREILIGFDVTVKDHRLKNELATSFPSVS